MKMRKTLTKITFIFLISCVILLLFAVFVYLKLLPAVVRNQNVIQYVENSVNKYTELNLNIENPDLKTSFSQGIEFKVQKIKLTNGTEVLLETENFDTSISFAEILKKNIIVNKFGADNLYVDANKLSEKFPKQEKKEQKPSEWNIDLFNSILYLKDSTIIYNTTPDTLVKISAKNIEIDNTQKLERFVHFNIDIDITKNNRTVNIAVADENKVVIKNKHLYVNDCGLTINKSKMFFNAEIDAKKNYEMIVYAKRFFIPDVIKLLLTDIVENNIRDILVYFDKINGDFDFAITFDNTGMKGEVKLNKVNTKILPLANLPVIFTNGTIKLDEKNIVLSDFEGYYDNKNKNTFSFKGKVDDYLKSMDTTIDMNAALTDDFTSKYITPLVGIPVNLTGIINSKIVIKSIYNKFDIMMAGKVKKGDDILIDGASLSPVGYDRAVKTDLHFEDNILNIKDINYYIASELKRGIKVKPILTLNGNFDVVQNKLLDIGFDIPNPLPSEFLNVLIGQKMFKKGTFSGNMHYYDTDDFPVLKGDMQAEKIIIPSQRLFLKKGSIYTVDGDIKLNADGKYRRSEYNFTGTIGNAVKYPIVIKDINLTVDDVDIEKMIMSMNTAVENNDTAVEHINSETDIETDEGAPSFDVSNLIVNNCVLRVVKGHYKDINFDDLKAVLTLDKDGILKVESNKFNIAEGISTAKINCDLKKHLYSLRLGIKEVNSDIMSTSILNLPREISGKASGLIELNTDDRLKLNGLIKFAIKDGQIQKVGLVEYVLKFAALFRNPLVMISPSVFSDMVNIPEGNFEKITGDLHLKDNVIEKMQIKSYSEQLSAYIAGRYDLEQSDASLRIYTKFSNKNKGFAGALRNISLNSLANRIPLSGRNDSNYYAAELEQLPAIDAEEKDCQIFLTKVDGDVEHNNYISSLKKIK